MALKLSAVAKISSMAQQSETLSARQVDCMFGALAAHLQFTLSNQVLEAAIFFVPCLRLAQLFFPSQVLVLFRQQALCQRLAA
jgi:hypothetical protein